MNKKWLRWSILAGLLLWMTFATPAAQAKTVQGDKVVIGGAYVLPAGQALEGNLVVVGGEATVEHDARVTGDARVMGGLLRLAGTLEGDLSLTGGKAVVSGEIDGDVKIVGGVLVLGPDAVVKGEVQPIGGEIRRAPQSQAEIAPDDAFEPPFVANEMPPFHRTPFHTALRWVGKAFLALLRAIALAVLAGVVFLLPDGLARDAIAKMEAAPLVTGGLGLLIFALLPVVVVALAITLVLIPLAVVVIVVAAVAVLYGWLALGLYLGEKMLEPLQQSWHPAGAAALGTFVLTLLAALVNVVPCVGWVPGFLAAAWGLGAVSLALWEAWQRQSGKGASGDEVVTVPPAGQAD